MKKRFRLFISILLAMTLSLTPITNVFAGTSQQAAGSILVTVTNATGTLSTATDLNFTILDDLGTTVVTSLTSASPINGVYKIPAPSEAGFDKGTYYVKITEDSYKHNSLTVPVTVSSPTSNATAKVIWTKAPDDLSQIPGSKIAIVGGTAMSVSENADPVLATNSVIDLWDSKGNCYSTWSDGTTGVYKFYVPAGKYTVCAEASASHVVKVYSVTAAAGQMSRPYEEVVTNRTDANYDFGYSAPTGDKTNLCDSKIFTGQANAGCTVEIVNAGSTTSQHILGKVVAAAAKGAAKGSFKITLKSCYPGSKLEVWVIDTAHNIYVDKKTLDFSGSSFTMTATMPSSTTNDKDIAIKLADSAHPGNLTTITGVSYSTDGSVYTPLVITTQYTFVSGSLNIPKNTLTAGTYTFKITAPGYNTLTTGAYIFTAPASAALTVSAAPGSAAGTTKLTVTPASGDSIKYLVSSSSIASATLDTNVSGYSDYTLGSDISGADTTTNKYLAVAEINASGKVVKFKCLTLVAANMKAGGTTGGNTGGATGLGLDSAPIPIAQAVNGTTYITYTLTSGIFDKTGAENPFNWLVTVNGESATPSNVYLSDGNKTARLSYDGAGLSGNITIRPTQAAYATGTAPAAPESIKAIDKPIIPAISGVTLIDAPGNTSDDYNGCGIIKNLPTQIPAGYSYKYTAVPYLPVLVPNISYWNAPLLGQGLSSWHTIDNTGILDLSRLLAPDQFAAASLVNGCYLYIAEADTEGNLVKFEYIKISGITDYQGSTQGQLTGTVSLTDAYVQSLTPTTDATKTFTVSVDGGAPATITVTFSMYKGYLIGAAIENACTVTVDFDSNNCMIIKSLKYGAGSKVTVGGPDAALIFGPKPVITDGKDVG